MNNKRTKGKISRDFGMKDYYTYYKNTVKNPQSAQKFNKIVSEFNKRIMYSIINDNLEFSPIKTQLTICIRKVKRQIRIQNNRVINTNPIDWKTTMKLWNDDEEAKTKKLVIRYLNNHSSKYIFRIKIIKDGTSYINKKYYRFKPCRLFQRELSKRILDPNKENFEAFELYKLKEND